MVYQILSESPEFCGRYYKKKHFGLYFSGHSVYIHVKMLTAQPVAKLILSQIHGHRATVI